MEMTNDFKEYTNKVLKRYSKRKGKITNSWGSKYIYRSVGRECPIKLVSEKDFLAIIREVNNSLSDKLARGVPISLPYLGIFYIANIHSSVRKENNKIVNSRKIDWKTTLKLWYDDKEAERNKTLIRFKNSDYMRLMWNKRFFRNKSVFKFRACRSLKAKIKENINKNQNILSYTI